MAEVNGQGIPLGFFLHGSTDGTAETGAKSRALTAFLRYFADRCPNVKFTLTDKELEEIKSLRTCFPLAKLILCLWHILRAIEARLAKDSPPGTYDPKEAHALFDFIDDSWLPLFASDAKSAAAEANSGSVRPRSSEELQEEFEQDKEVRAGRKHANRGFIISRS